MAKSKRVEFELPEGFSQPDISSNGEFDALATIKIKPDGSACLVAIDGYRMPGYREEDESESDSDNRSYAQAAADGMEGMR